MLQRYVTEPQDLSVMEIFRGANAYDAVKTIVMERKSTLLFQRLSIST